MIFNNYDEPVRGKVLHLAQGCFESLGFLSQRFICWSFIKTFSYSDDKVFVMDQEELKDILHRIFLAIAEMWHSHCRTWNTLFFKGFPWRFPRARMSPQDFHPVLLREDFQSLYILLEQLLFSPRMMRHELPHLLYIWH